MDFFGTLEKASTDIPPKGFKHSLMLQIEGVSSLSFYPEWMHCKSLGIDTPLLGSTLYVLVHHILTGTVEENVVEVWGDIEHCYVELNSEMNFSGSSSRFFTFLIPPFTRGHMTGVSQ